MAVKILAVMQARSSSSRLPGKVLKPILGKAMVLHELERLQRSRYIDKVVLATSRDASDDDLADLVAADGVSVYRGSLDDVLDRFYQCAAEYQPEHVVRITGDCPVIDWRVVDTVIKKHLDEGNDYTATTEQFPDGLDTEVMRFQILAEAWKEAKLPSEREHVTPYIKKQSERFQLGTLACEHDWNKMRWTVDEPQDFDFVCQVYRELYPASPDFSMQDILELLGRRPEMLGINQGIQRNEGLLKSLKADKHVD